MSIEGVQDRAVDPDAEHPPRDGAITRARTVLVIEDDPAIGNMLVALLNAEGYRAELMADGQAALSTLRTRRPDLITLDLSLPTVDGIEILDRLDAHGGADVPVVVVSAYTERLTEEHQRQVAAVVQKPFELDDLLSSITIALQDG